MGLTFFVKAAENTFLYLFSTFLLLMATKFLGFSRNQAINALLWGSALEILVILASAHLSDRIGRRPIILVGLLCSMARRVWAVYAGAWCDLWSAAVGDSVSCQPWGYPRSDGCIFGPSCFRPGCATGLSTSYQLASVLGGSIAPIVGTVLLEKTGTNLSVAFYAAAMAIPALIWVYLSRETRGRDFFDNKGGPHRSKSSVPQWPARPAVSVWRHLNGSSCTT